MIAALVCRWLGHHDRHAQQPMPHRICVRCYRTDYR